ncbi:DgyrCDS7904 [Dimorphilus gyrociliatus]|uniref:DgyrCDS7904 n=1 Tax=Dimorphilus gyrociliatus TaxID=2664684 RepID=A0A7I8VUR3_9ANNE|nr:DgyrCDS7904 [Dimorphilus gyrociliatus]
MDNELINFDFVKRLASDEFNSIILHYNKKFWQDREPSKYILNLRSERFYELSDRFLNKGDLSTFADEIKHIDKRIFEDIFKDDRLFFYYDDILFLPQNIHESISNLYDSADKLSLNQLKSYVRMTILLVNFYYYGIKHLSSITLKDKNLKRRFRTINNIDNEYVLDRFDEQEITIESVKDIKVLTSDLYEEALVPLDKKTDSKQELKEFDGDDNDVSLELIEHAKNAKMPKRFRIDPDNDDSNKCFCCRCSKKINILAGVISAISIFGIIGGTILVTKDILFNSSNSKDEISYKSDYYNNKYTFNTLWTKRSTGKFSTKMEDDPKKTLHEISNISNTYLNILISLLCIAVIFVVFLHFYRRYIRKYLFFNRMLKSSKTNSDVVKDG